jgi:hypothetical protein
VAFGGRCAAIFSLYSLTRFIQGAAEVGVNAENKSEGYLCSFCFGILI